MERGFSPSGRPTGTGIATTALWIVGTCVVLALIVSIAPIAPLVESDYAYLLTAANRLVEGAGLTTTPPLAPYQSWDWRGDWTFLTKWPIGYALIVAGLHWTFGIGTLIACRWISIGGCVIALVGWFTWALRSVSPGPTRYVFAAACAGLALPVAWLVNPSTDLLVVAALPWLMQWTMHAVNLARESKFTTRRRPGLHFAAIGLVAGSLFWIRYAAVFVPLAIGFHLVCERMIRRRPPLATHVLTFATAGAMPVLLLVGMNTLLGDGESTSRQWNLGDRVAFDFSLTSLHRAWWMFTDLGYYAHRPLAHKVFAVWPALLIAGAVAIRPVRKRAAEVIAKSEFTLSAAVVVLLLTMLIAAKTLFSGKFDYVGLDRYYQPIKPLYLILFVAPVLARRTRWVRAGVCAGLILACSWTVQQDWLRPYVRWSKADRPTTPSGAWSRCFEPGAEELYAWLAANRTPSLIVASNCHEYIVVETDVPAIPTPPDRRTLDTWIARIRQARGVDSVRVVFALDPSNKWRDHWLDAPELVIRRLGLVRLHGAPGRIAPYLFEPADRARPLTGS